MPRQLTFRLGDDEIALAMHKVDRSKLYGYKEQLVLDENDEQCELVTLAGDGRTLIGRGGLAMAYMTPDREWRTKDELTPIDLDGQEIEPVPSSFNAPIPLEETVDIETFLDHDMRIVYQMEADEGVKRLHEALADATIYRFPFSYRGGLEADAGFLLQASDGHVFMLIGREATSTFVGLQESTGMADTGEDEDEGDELDFGVM